MNWFKRAQRPAVKEAPTVLEEPVLPTRPPVNIKLQAQEFKLGYGHKYWELIDIHVPVFKEKYKWVKGGDRIPTFYRMMHWDLYHPGTLFDKMDPKDIGL